MYTATPVLLLLCTITGLYFLLSFSLLSRLQWKMDSALTKAMIHRPVGKHVKTVTEYGHCKYWLIIRNGQQSNISPLCKLINHGHWCVAILGNTNALFKCYSNQLSIFHIGNWDNVTFLYSNIIEQGAEFVLMLDESGLTSFNTKMLENVDRSSDETLGDIVVENSTWNAVTLMSVYDVFQPGNLTKMAYRFYHNSRSPSLRVFIPADHPHLPQLTIGHFICIPFDFTRAVFDYSVYWALLPVENTDMKSIWILRLLQEINGHVRAIPVHSQKINVLITSINPNYRSAIDFVTNWQCPVQFKFIQCIRSLMDEMGSNGFWSRDQQKGVQNWIDQLMKIGYRFPIRRNMEIGQSNSNIIFTLNSQYSYEGKVKSIETLKNLCPEIRPHKTPAPAFSSLDHLKNVVLVIILNHPHSDRIPILQNIYEPWFPMVIFCSTFTWDPQNITFLNISREEFQNGVYSYKCLFHVISMRLTNIRGYLVGADDVLLNYWTYFDPSGPVFHFGSCETLTDEPSVWWFSEHGESSLKKVRAFLYYETEQIKLNNQTKYFLKKSLLKDAWCASEIYYIPSDHESDFQILADLFYRAGTFVEIAIPKIMASLGLYDQYDGIIGGTENKEAQRDTDFRGKYLWKNKDRARPFKYYNTDAHFIHPFKVSWSNETYWRGQYCKNYVDAMFRAVLF